MSAETLLAETLRLAAQYSSADLGAFREALAERRRPTEALRPNPPQQ
jgi:predicted HTH domain antitoxin